MKTGLAISIALLATSHVAFAQQNDSLPSRRVDVSLGARVEYDSNVLRAGSGGNQDDIIASPTLDVDILLPFGRNSSYLSGSAGYRFHQSHQELDRENIALDGGADIHIGPGCVVSASGSWVRRQTDLIDIYDTLPARNTEQSLSEGIRAGCGLNLGIAPSLGYTHRNVSNSAKLRRENDYNIDTFDGALGYSRPLLGTISVYGSYSDASYPNRVAIGPSAVNDGTRSYQIGLRYERNIGARLRGKVSGGWSKVKPRLSGVRGFRGVFYAADLTATFAERLQVTAGAARTVDQSNLLAISYAITDTLRADATYAFSPYVKLSLGTGWTHRRLHASPVAAIPIFVPRDRLWDISSSLTLARGNHVRIGLDAVWRRRSGTGDIGNFKRFVTGLSIRYKM